MQRQHLFVGEHVLYGQYVAEVLHAFLFVHHLCLAVGCVQLGLADTDAELFLAVVTNKDE